MGPESLSTVYERGAESGLGQIKILPGLLRVDRRYKIDKRAKEERDGSQTLKCVHHCGMFHGSFLKVCDVFLSHMLQTKLQRLPTDCAEMKLNVTAHFLLSSFSFMYVLFAPGHHGLLSPACKKWHFLIEFLSWHWLIKLYRFQVYNYIYIYTHYMHI